MSSTIINFGKYKGLSFKQVLDKDVNYCEFILRCPPGERTESFAKYLALEMPAKNKQVIQDQIDILKEKLRTLP